ncbi:amino acid/amide ABC transporter membrane protein 1, HAAT family (TC 3.A.1.4.-) [Vibrio xiamenensis]|uniref:Amino acid/amide ABC transporter membrane protein 1, HAAT family (TC 3.A.1.4.-) n=1 Tax=Vibrio xiamenensis TaxID=861298 RepID=A0A1G8AMP1_9VIBR|nr:urea ABC transporter permease subunit UrtB [Vibrio xiamenensis]SDH22149.1 amino acid/amide ABC transporter membrane protein 1, HAAT family (TC 3.A.1.4.-) [Vibrio xiamenensis]
MGVKRLFFILSPTWLRALLMSVALLIIHIQPSLSAENAKFEQGLEALKTGSFSQISQGVSAIAQSGDERAAAVLTLLLHGDLYRLKQDSSLVTIQSKQGRDYVIAPLFASAEDQTQSVKSRAIKKIGINNKVRGELKSMIAALNISNPDANRRLDAINQLMGDMDQASYQLLKSHLESETDSDVLELGSMALAIFDLSNSTDNAVLKAALDVLQSSYQPSARNALNQYLNQHPDSALNSDVRKALASIEQREKVADMAQTLFFGLSLGSVLVLAAIGLAITFGVMGVINMAHGELIMLGAYTTYVVQTLMPNHIGLSLFVSIPLAFLVSALAGVVIERCVIRFLYGRPLETLLATFGISLVLQQAVRSVFSPLNRSVSTPDWMQGVIEINPLLSLTLNRLYIIAFCLIVFVALYLILRFTRLGIEVRAVSQNRSMARAMGVRSEWVDAMTFGLGSGIAGIAGVALSQLTNVGPNLGQSYIIDSFMVVVFGGVGNLWGTLVAGMSLGVANKVLEPWAGAVLAKILVLVFIILFIQKKPRGLFPQKGRSAEG